MRAPPNQTKNSTWSNAFLRRRNPSLETGKTIKISTPTLTRDAGPKPHIVAEKNPRGPYIVGQRQRRGRDLKYYINIISAARFLTRRARRLNSELHQHNNINMGTPYYGVNSYNYTKGWNELAHTHARVLVPFII